MSGLTYVQAKYNRAAGSSTTLTYTSNCTPGSILFCLVASDGAYTYGTAGDVSDPTNGNWNFLGNCTSNWYGGLFWVKNTASTALTVTCKGASVISPTISEFTFPAGFGSVDAFTINAAAYAANVGSYAGYWFPAIASNNANESIILLGAEVSAPNGVQTFVGNGAFANDYFSSPNKNGNVQLGYFASATNFNGTTNGWSLNSSAGTYQGVVAAISIAMPTSGGGSNGFGLLKLLGVN